MALIAWVVLVVIYVSGGVLYIAFSPFEPLGAMANDGAVSMLLTVVFTGLVGVALGYYFLSKTHLPSIKDINSPSFLKLCSHLYLFLACVVFVIGVQYYGGYWSFINAPYIAIYGGSAQNQTQDTLISTSGLLAVFSIISSVSSKGKSHNNKLLILISTFILISIFYQGRRENLVLLVVTYISFKLFSGSLNIKHLLKLLFLFFVLLFLVGVGLYLREDGSTSGGNIISAVLLAVLFETHFTVATLANVAYSHLVDGLPYSGVLNLLSPALFMVPGFVFSLLGVSKQAFFSAQSNVSLYEDKGGDFIFSEAFNSFGYVGVFIHGFLLGILILLFYRAARRTGLIIYHFPLVSLLLVAIRKDLTYGLKYISLMYMLMFFFYIIYLLTPKMERWGPK